MFVLQPLHFVNTLQRLFSKNGLKRESLNDEATPIVLKVLIINKDLALF
jgi:hypothetical protein